MNILMALSQLEVTGAEVYGVTISDELIKRGHNVTIVSDTLSTKCEAEYIKIEFNKRSGFNRFSQVKKLLKIIKEKNIHVVHAHSRASSWSCEIACKIANIPLITTTHGRQPIHFSRRLFKGFGRETIAVCENIKNHLINDLGVDDKKITVLRNPMKTEFFTLNEEEKESSEKKIISIIGRLSGPKGDVAYELLEKLSSNKNFLIQIIGGKTIPENFNKFVDMENVIFLGFIDDVATKIRNSDIIIGAGRVAIETLLYEKPLIAVGEAKFIGFINQENIIEGLESNFGDIAEKQSINLTTLSSEIEKALNFSKKESKYLRNQIENEISLKQIVDKIEKIYAKQYVLTKKYEIPILMYHRVIEDVEKEGGAHGIYVTKSTFEKHLQYLHKSGYQTITFSDILKEKNPIPFEKGKKQIILTFDDGYKDNYIYAFPLLKKYNSKAVIYLLSDLNYNKWDTDNPKNPEKKFELMEDFMIKEMQEYGIEFGGHTRHHYRLSTLTSEEKYNEIALSKEKTENLLNQKLISFAYPYGDLDIETKKIVEKVGYKFAVATDSGDISFFNDLYQIRRIGIFSTNSFLTFKRKVSGKYNFIKIKREEKEKKCY